MRVAACEATEVQHTQSSALLDLRMQCLDRRRAELVGIVTAWRDTPEREQIARAAGAVLQLTTLDGCADPAASNSLQKMRSPP